MHGALRLLAAAIVSFGAAVGTAHAADPRLDQPIPLDHPDQALFAEAVLIYSNEVRRQHGRAALRPDPALVRAAAAIRATGVLIATSLERPRRLREVLTTIASLLTAIGPPDKRARRPSAAQLLADPSLLGLA